MDAGTGLAGLLDEVRRIEVLSRRLVAGPLSGGYHAAFRGTGVAFEDVREYAEGDDARSIDWNVTARVGRPHVKRYREERELTVIFLLDLSPSMDAGFGPWSARRAAARVCACLALAAVRNQDRSGLVAFSGGIDSFVPPRRGLGHALRIVRDGLALRGRDTRPGMGTALEFAARALRRRAIVFLLSDFLSGTGGDALPRCARRHDLVAVRLLSPELDLPEAGLLRVRDPEGGAETVIDAGSPRVRRAWAEGIASWKARTEAELRRARVDLVDVPIPRVAAADPAVAAILRFFRMREERGAKR